MIKLNADLLNELEGYIGVPVEVTWYDHFSTASNEAYSVKQIDSMDLNCVRVSVGYLIRVNKNVMVLAACKEEDGAYSDITVLLVPVIKTFGYL